jgi:anaerobic ribonucleoside-triphosphate reductase activating protein
MKYTDTQITFTEFPDEISLCINISNCHCHCHGCHSPELWEDVGTELSLKELDKLISSNKGITCVGFMGGDSNPTYINALATYIKHNYKDLKVGWYSGNTKLSDIIDTRWFDYIKIGPYIKELGGLDNSNTNQRFYKVENGQLIDWTYKFWKHGN